MDVARFKDKSVMGILRGAELGVIEPLIEEVISCGLETLEITMNSKDAVKLISKAKAVAKTRLALGAGTVLSLDSLKQALDAGATFIVTPVLIEEISRYCVKNKIPVFPGALSPLEIYKAWVSGATMVKVFPAKAFGPDYFKEIKEGPFQDIELLACSGVTPENLGAYFKNGASAVSFGSSVFKREWLASSDFKSIGSSIKKYLEVFSEGKQW